MEGAEPGDVLKVTINQIQLDSRGTVVSGEELGILGGILKDTHTKIIPLQDGKALFSNDIQIPLKPMIGVIGVAPKDTPINTGTPGKHGGNMDNTMVAEGAILYFNVEVPGALFALGDVHAFFFIKEKRRNTIGDIVKYLISPVCGVAILLFIFSGFESLTYIIGFAWLAIGIVIGAIKSKGYKEVPEAFKNLQV